jgi:hypothetical protein
LLKAKEVSTEAYKLLGSAYRLNSRLTPACSSQGRAALISGRGNAFRVGKCCTSADPASYSALIEWRVSAEPRWGGGLDQLTEVAQFAKENREKNPLLDAVIASAEADELLYSSPSDLDVKGLERALSAGPQANLFNVLSFVWDAKQDNERSLIYLAQAVRFDASLGFRIDRYSRTWEKNPDWAIADLEYLIRRFPTSQYFRSDLENAKLNVAQGLPAKLARGESVGFYGHSRMTGSWQCEKYSLSDRILDKWTATCSEHWISVRPDDPESWRVHAEVLHFRKDT